MVGSLTQAILWKGAWFHWHTHHLFLFPRLIESKKENRI